MVRNIRSRSFTLMEMLVVIGIIAILAALIATAVVKVGDNAKRAQVQMDISTIYKALAEYKNKYGDYPTVSTSQEDLTYDKGSSSNMMHLLISTRLLDFDLSRVDTSTNKVLDPWKERPYQIKQSNTAPVTGMVGAGGDIYIWSYGTAKNTSTSNSDEWIYSKGGN